MDKLPRQDLIFFIDYSINRGVFFVHQCFKSYNVYVAIASNSKKDF